MREMVLKSFSLYGNEQMIGFFPVEIADWFLFFLGVGPISAPFCP